MGIDPYTGEYDPHGIPQIDCPARLDQVNPQFTCRHCPCAIEMETHQAIDDRGSPFHVVDAVECGFDGEPSLLAALWQRFPSLLEGLIDDAPPRTEPGVPCPLLTWPKRSAPILVEVDGVRWIPVSHCCACQFYRGTKGRETTPGMVGQDAGLAVVCASPRHP